MKLNKPLITLLLLLILLLTSSCGIMQDMEVQLPPNSGLLEVHFIDVGQGDAIWIKTPQDQNLLIDAGGNRYGDYVVDYLSSHGVTSLTAVIGTHPHEDHIGGLDRVIDSFDIEKVYMPKVLHNTKTFEDVLDAVDRKGLKISTAKAGVPLALQGVDAEFLAPVSEKYKELNNYSAVLRLQYGTQVFLFMGDAEQLSEQEMLSSYPKAVFKANVLKVGHHGSTTSTGDPWLNAVNPQYAVILSGKDNTYGHPHKEILEKLKERDIKIYRTDEKGTIVFQSDGKTISVK
ncbi:Metal-dependent hydrolase, beta-lactamase superfamily II [Geosporobacter subterraneus DSM 17957]|uniref:Metal-dependent hydrolase, beta-lactamase superfamily II n=1 Tax=Geosporobacter subterraneus DSM 17957 TaxID=1121919 RepID=A0A1M6CKV3_9FIRM|nr:ComEC/Rec2 family competence protein [Geosporobacter subterraneus]SHI61394.1 Metal-dependent hydrolase, beta-lactamase superfamily II [Geosporobacter subterraneus DSM 17957]